MSATKGQSTDMNTAAQDLASELGRELKLVNFTPMEPETELARIASAHRRGVAKYEQRIADTKKQMKLDVAELEAARLEEKKRHETAMAEIAEHIAGARDKASQDMVADRRLVASCRAALVELDRE